MNLQLPIRGNAQQLEAESEQYFRRYLPRSWTCDKPASDYGVDLRVGIVMNDCVTGIELLVQLKASAKVNHRDYETFKFSVSTYNYLSNQLNIVLLVKYAENEQEAYWTLLKDIQPPAQTKKTFTVRIPKIKKLSGLSWESLMSEIVGIHDLKLGAAQNHVRFG